ncbi:arylesterase [Wenzhouxiangella sp. AB-CW3]|uniref:arylesterase n=1 Tax=Wenzhouxiangella sp. AB-CW3 TaxID=2771012 RepID=UPI001CC2E3E1|nr:arylesterase [Wenzhouxiangella sp. AB-CW3]
MMKKYSRLVLSLLVLSLACAVVPLQARTLLVVGDSLSDAYNMPREAGWAHLLSERLGDDYEVVNASISGETTAGAASRIDDLLADHHPDVLLIILGGNDGLRALSPRQIKDNLAAVIEKGKASGAKVALMQIRMPPNLGPAYVRRFEEVYPALSERHDIELVPFFLDELFDQPGMMMPDGIHPAAQAQPGMLDRLWPELEPLLR